MRLAPLPAGADKRYDPQTKLTEVVRNEQTEDANQQVPAFYKRRRKRGDELGQILLRRGQITPEQLRAALKLQTEEGGHLGAILKRMGACDARAIAEALLEQVRVTRDKGKARELETRARETPSIMGLTVQCRPGLTKLAVIFSDVLAISLGTGLAWLFFNNDTLGRVQRFGILAVLPLCLLIFTYVQLYAATPPSPPEEIRRSTLAITFVCVGLWLASFLVRSGGWEGVQHLAWVTTWLVGVLFVPLLRATLARLAQQGELHQVVKDLYCDTPTMARLAAIARGIGAAQGKVTAASFRDATQLGRKRAIQHLEHFDRVGLLRRVGDEHRLRADSALFSEGMQS